MLMLRAMTTLVWMPCPSETGRKHTRHGRPWKTKVVQPIDEVVKELLNDFEITDGRDENLF
jgi:hypothetical protein